MYYFCSVKDKKYIEIIEGAAENFMRYGVKAVTMDDLSRFLGISKKTIYKHFNDKKELVSFVLESKVKLNAEKCENLVAFAENAIDELISVSNFVNTDFGSIHSSVFYDIEKYYPEAWQILEQHKSQFVKNQIIKNIKRGINEGLYRPNLNAEIVAVVYVNTLNSIFSSFYEYSNEYTISEILTEVIRFMIRGLSTEKGLIELKKRINKQHD